MEIHANICLTSISSVLQVFNYVIIIITFV